MIVEVITALVSGFSDVLGKSLGRYRYLLISFGGYLLGFSVGFVLSIYFYIQLGRFNWAALLFSTVGLGSILALGGVFIAFVNRPKSAEVTESAAQHAEAEKPDSSSQAISVINSADWRATNEARTTLVVEPSDIENNPIFKQLARREMPVIVVQKPNVKKPED